VLPARARSNARVDLALVSDAIEVLGNLLDAAHGVLVFVLEVVQPAFKIVQGRLELSFCVSRGERREAQGESKRTGLTL
jgi:hypothetical protein